MSPAARENSANPFPAATMTARNAPCPCGSGKKFKHCHGAAAGISAATPNPTSGSSAAAFQQLVTALGQGELSQAENALREWPINSQPAELSYFQAVVAQLKGDFEQALAHYAEAIRLQRAEAGSSPLNQATMAVAAANQLHETAAGNYPGAPGRREDGMFACAAELQLLEDALLDWEQDPDSPFASQEVKRIHANAWYNLGCAALAGFTADDRCIRLFEKAVELDSSHLLAQFNRAFAHNYSFNRSPAQIREAHQQAASWLESRQPSTPPQCTSKADGLSQRIRLAYLSSDFRQHSVAHFILPVLQQHDRQRFEVFVYHNHSQLDEITRLVEQTTEHFRHIARLSDDQLKDQMLADQIDVLIDLNGLTNGHRLAALAQRLAPVQLNWMGYPNTTGLTQMDFRLVDELTDPVGQSEAYCSEELIRLRHPFLCFAAPADMPAVSDPPFLKNGYITFGSFNALPKLNPPLLNCWAKILQAVPEARLLIKNLGMDYAGPRSQLSEILAAQGIEAHRLVLIGKNRFQTDHLKHYAQTDISLDSFPYNGTTTSCDSLAMGVPVLSRYGNEHRSRVGLSLLTAMGLESLVASDENSLVNMAVSLATDRDKLQSLRAGLRGRLLSSSLTDAVGLTRDLETQIEAIRSIWLNSLVKEGVT